MLQDLDDRGQNKALFLQSEASDRLAGHHEPSQVAVRHIAMKVRHVVRRSYIDLTSLTRLHNHVISSPLAVKIGRDLVGNVDIEPVPILWLIIMIRPALWF